MILLYKLKIRIYNNYSLIHRKCLILKKSIALIIALTMVISTILVSCKDTTKNVTDQTTTEGLESSDTELGFENVEVTDEDGKKVTDKNGETVTKEVLVEYVTDKKGNTIANLIGDDNEPITDKHGNNVTAKTDYEKTTAPPATEDDGIGKPPETVKTTKSPSTTKPTSKNEATTENEYTTLKPSQVKVPTTSDSGAETSFSQEDQETIKSLLEVPYLFTESYENADGVPVSIATHAAIWMAEREGLSTRTFASGTIVLGLFKYFDQTVVNFKTNCNDAKNENITYYASNDTFRIKSYETPTHSIKITSIQDLGNNNFYKITADVSGTNKAKKVVAVVEKNRLDATLGFSIKALKWS